MNVLENLIGWLAPPYCVGCGAAGRALCLICHQVEILPYGEKCWRCGARSSRGATCPGCRRGSPKFIWISTDYEAAAKALVTTYKFGHLRAAAVPMADIMLETFLRYSSDEDITSKKYLVVPVPTAAGRVRQRGFDHSALLARHLKTKLSLDFSRCVGRIGKTRQVGAKKAQRLTQLNGRFYIKRPKTIKDRHVLLVDDVITTGATITEVAKTIRQGGAKSVSALVFAKKL